MKLLVLTNNPERPSFRQRIRIYVDLLRDNGIDCEIASVPGSLTARYRLLKRSADFDAVFLHKKRLNLIEAPLLRRYARRIIYDFDDAIMYKPGYPNRFNISSQARFRLTVKLADLVIAGNSYLAEHAKRSNKRVEILPTGLNTRDYAVSAEPQKDGKIRLVWIGSRSTLKYLTLIRPALEEIGSRFGNVVLRMICDEFLETEKISVEKRIWSSGTEVPDLVTSDIGLAPLPDNHFTRGKCGFKILQYAAAGLPSIASPVGVNSEYVRDGVTGFLASDTKQWVEKISRLVEDGQVRAAMGENALKFVEGFDVGVIGEKLAALIRQCCGNVIS
ncbi:MAG: glycosyltransferase family 4 protein [Sedimentisphaerales bacterium]|nr:glycosyltransferase family 4 protein [Sedimentisphaerales bacterium]